MVITGEIEIQAAPEKVWEVLGREFGAPSVWARSVHQAEQTGGASKGDAPCDGRVCETSLGSFTEKNSALQRIKKRSLLYRQRGQDALLRKKHARPMEGISFWK